MKPTLDKYGIDFVVVGLHTHLAEDFLDKSGFKGQFVINKKKDAWTGVDKAGWFCLFNWTFMNQYLKSQAMGLAGTLDLIDGWQLGGLVVIDPPPHGEIVYQWGQPGLGIYPPVDEVLKEATKGMKLLQVADDKTSEVKASVDVTKKMGVVSGPANEIGDSNIEEVKAL